MTEKQAEVAGHEWRWTLMEGGYCSCNYARGQNISSLDWKAHRDAALASQVPAQPPAQAEPPVREWWEAIHHHIDNPSTPSGIPHDPPLLPGCTQEIWDVLEYMDYSTSLRAEELVLAIFAQRAATPVTEQPPTSKRDYYHEAIEKVLSMRKADLANAAQIPSEKEYYFGRAHRCDDILFWLGHIESNIPAGSAPVPAQGTPPACKCYKTNNFHNYAAVMTGCASEWTVTEDCPIHRKAAPASPQSEDTLPEISLQGILYDLLKPEFSYAPTALMTATAIAPKVEEFIRTRECACAQLELDLNKEIKRLEAAGVSRYDEGYADGLQMACSVALQAKVDEIQADADSQVAELRAALAESDKRARAEALEEAAKLVENAMADENFAKIRPENVRALAAQPTPAPKEQR